MFCVLRRDDARVQDPQAGMTGVPLRGGVPGGSLRFLPVSQSEGPQTLRRTQNTLQAAGQAYTHTYNPEWTHFQTFYLSTFIYSIFITNSTTDPSLPHSYQTEQICPSCL